MLAEIAEYGGVWPQANHPLSTAESAHTEASDLKYRAVKENGLV